MWLYLIIFFIPVVVYLYKPRGRKKKVTFLIGFLSLLAIFVGISDMLGGYDRYIYAELFDSMADVTKKGGNPFLSNTFRFYRAEFGYGSLNALISYITANRYIYILIVTLITYVLLIISLKQYTPNYPYAIILFLGLWFFFTFTYLRQTLSAATCWLSIQYVIKRKPLPFFLIVFIAYTFHNSAIAFAPLYFLPTIKFKKEHIILIMIICFILGLTNIAGALFGAYSSFSEVTAARAGRYAEEEGSFRIAYAIEAAFFLFIILNNYHTITKSKKQIVFLNMSLIFCAILLLFIRSDNGGRIAWHYMIGLISTLTYIVHHKKANPNLSKYLIIVCVFLYIRIYNAWQNYNNLYPYKTFFTNGYRTPDFSHDYFEYDSMYDINKFYR